jgi:hypothetical protein
MVKACHSLLVTALYVTHLPSSTLHSFKPFSSSTMAETITHVFFCTFVINVWNTLEHPSLEELPSLEPSSATISNHHHLPIPLNKLSKKNHHHPQITHQVFYT